MLAEFATPEQLLAAVRALRTDGYRRLETYTPFRIPEITEALRLPRSWLPVVIFAGGAGGGAAAFWIQWYANSWAYPLVVGGRPIFPIPAFIPAAFEGTVLAAALTGFFALLLRLGLPRLWHPVFEVDGFERATIDRFWLEIRGDDFRFDPALSRRALERLAPLRVVSLEEAGS